MNEKKQFLFKLFALRSGFNIKEIEDFLKDIKSKSDKIYSPIPLDNSQNSSSPNLDLAMNLIKEYFPEEEVKNAYQVMLGESGGNPQAVGDQYPIGGVYAPSYGLFQIRGLPGRPSSKELLNPEFNVQYAANMFKNQGWRPWTVAQKLGLVR